MRSRFLVVGILLCATILYAEDVFLDFTTDLHDGAGGAPNMTADWIDELNQATASVGITNFTAMERTTIETNIKTHLETMFTGYNATFMTSTPTSPYDTIYFGAELGGGVLGNAPLDIANLFSEQTVNVAPEAFDFIIESGDSPADQISELSLALAGTAAHELGHSFGLLHHHAYSNDGITPANYAATTGLQNDHIIATGSTGLDEIGRETIRTFAPFSEQMLDITGGAALTFIGQDNESYVVGPRTSDFAENGTFSTLGTDAGGTISTAFVLDPFLIEGPTSMRRLAFIEADLDVAGNVDIDVYKFTTTAAGGTLLAHVYSDRLVYGPGAEFDPQLELLDSVGTVLATNDDVFYSGNTYGGPTFREDDPFLLNVPLATADDYYLRVTSVSGGELGSNYYLVMSVDGMVVPVELESFSVE